ncbi:MAG: FHA domain-containing protein, partial [Pleurocapsa sp.]
MTGNYSNRTVVNTDPYIELDNQGRKEILNLKEGVNYLGRDPSWASIQVPQDWNVVSRKQAMIEKDGGGFRIYDGDRHSQKPSGNGIFLNQSRINL